MDINELIRMDKLDGKDVLVNILFKLCALVFIIGSTLILADWIVTTSPSEPQWWVNFENWAGVTW